MPWHVQQITMHGQNEMHSPFKRVLVVNQVLLTQGTELS